MTRRCQEGPCNIAGLMSDRGQSDPTILRDQSNHNLSCNIAGSNSRGRNSASSRVKGHLVLVRLELDFDYAGPRL